MDIDAGRLSSPDFLKKRYSYFVCQSNFIDPSIFMKVIIKTKKSLAPIRALHNKMVFFLGSCASHHPSFHNF